MPQLLESILDQVRLTTLLDIGITALLIYWLFSLIRGTRAVRLVIGVSVLFARLRAGPGARAAPRSRRSSRPAPSSACSRSSSSSSRSCGAALERIGRVGLVRPGSLSPAEQRAAEQVAGDGRPGGGPRCRASGHGALIVLERETGLEEIAETGVMIHGDLSADLLETIFMPRTRPPRRRRHHPRRDDPRRRRAAAARRDDVHPSGSGRAIAPRSGSRSRPTRSWSSCPRRTARSASSSGRASCATCPRRSSRARSSRCSTRGRPPARSRLRGPRPAGPDGPVGEPPRPRLTSRRGGRRPRPRAGGATPGRPAAGRPSPARRGAAATPRRVRGQPVSRRPRDSSSTTGRSSSRRSVLATLLYVGLVLSQNSQRLAGPVPIDVPQPAGNGRSSSAASSTSRASATSRRRRGRPGRERRFTRLDRPRGRQADAAAVDRRARSTCHRSTRGSRILDWTPRQITVRLDPADRQDRAGPGRPRRRPDRPRRR